MRDGEDSKGSGVDATQDLFLTPFADLLTGQIFLAGGLTRLLIEGCGEERTATGIFNQSPLLGICSRLSILGQVLACQISWAEDVAHGADQG